MNPKKNLVTYRKVEKVIPAKPKITIAGYLAHRLVEAGLTHFFTVPGDFTLAMLDEFLKESNLKMVSCCNELNAGYAADGYARATGGIGAVMVTYMVGGLSVINAVAGAYSDDLPVICISGGPNTVDSFERHLVHHTIGEKELYQQSKCFEPIVKKCFVIKHQDDAADMIDEAISLSMKTRKPVYLEVPVNLATFLIDHPVQLQKAFDFPATHSDKTSLSFATSAIVNSINASTKPVVIAGSKLRKARATKEFLDFVNVIGCGVAVMPDAKGLFPETHTNYMGRYWGSVSMPYVSEVVESADLIIMVGPVFNDYTTTGWSTLLPKDKLIIIHPDSVTVGNTHYPNVALKDILNNLMLNNLPIKDSSIQAFKRYMIPGITYVRDKCENMLATDKLTLRYLQCAVEASITPKTTLIAETGDSWFIGQNVALPDGAKYMVQMQYGSIGWSVGALLGVALAEGAKRDVIALIGDGSFQVTAQELSTLIRYQCKATILLLNNKGYTIEVQIHDGPYNDIQVWDYKGIIDVFNGLDGKGLGLQASTCGELRAALDQADKHDGLCLIECDLARDDCTSELLEWGSHVASANARR